MDANVKSTMELEEDKNTTKVMSPLDQEESEKEEDKEKQRPKTLYFRKEYGDFKT